MGSVSSKGVREVPNPLEDNEVLDNSSLRKETDYTYDDDSLHGPSYQQLFENILPKQIDVLPETNGNNISEVTMGANSVPVAKPQRPNSIYNQETGSYNSNQSNLSGDSFPSRLIFLQSVSLK